MDTNMTSNIASFVNKEAIKTEMLDIIVELYKEHNIYLGKKSKEFVLVRTEQLINEYDIPTKVLIKRFKLDNGELSAPCVELDTFDIIFEDFRTKMTKIFLQLLLHDLGRFIEDNIKEEK